MARFGPMGGGEGIPAIVTPKKYHPQGINPTVERYNKLYGYPVATLAVDDVQKTFGIGTIGLLVQFIALGVLAAMPIWIYQVGIDYLTMFGRAVSHNFLFLAVAVVYTVISTTGFIISRKFKYVHYGSKLSCGIFTHTVPIFCGMPFVFVPIAMLGGF